MHKLIYIILVALGTMSMGCTNEEPREIDGPTPIEPEKIEWEPASLKAVAKENVGKANDFSINLFKEVYAGTGGNLCLSPTSIFCTLAMMANGDTGASRDELLKLLGYGAGEEALSQLNVFANALLVEVPSLNGHTTCTFTNSIWHNPAVKLYPQFVNHIETIYYAQVFNINPGDENGRVGINNFVEENTKGMIKEFLKEPIFLPLVFMNTTYFKGEWEKSFDKESAYDYIFQNLDGTESLASYMVVNYEMEYGTFDGLRGLILPYSDGKYIMTLIQPTEDSDFTTMLANLDKKKIENLRASFKKHNVTIHLPKFESEINLDLTRYLKDMGLQEVYDTGLDNVGINTASGNDRFMLHLFKHAVKIIIDEEGTEAAGVSMAGMLDYGGGDDDIMIFNHPFIYLIQDTISDTVLFIGAITEF